jgi:tetratricopeptide (TPR) repeat protein
MRRLYQVAFLVFLSLPFALPIRAQSDSAPGVDAKQQAASLFEQGQTAQEKGNLNTAIRLYTRAVSADPSLYQAYYQRAVALLGLEQTDDAQADLRKTIQIEPAFARAHRALGMLLLDRGITQEARTELARAVELDPKLKGVRVYYASSLIKSGNPAEAIEQLHAAIDLGEADAITYALLGLAEERAGKRIEAMGDYTRAIQMNPNQVTAREGRARLYELNGDHSKAIEDYTEAYKTAPSLDTAFKLAGLYLGSGQSQAAIGIYRDLVRERPDDLNLRLDLLRIMADNGQADEARRQVAALVQAQPRNPRLLMLTGDILAKDDPAAAAGYYRTVCEVDSANKEAQVRLAAALVRSRQFDESLPVLQKALDLDPENFQAHSNLATALFELKQYAQAAQQFLWLVNRKPGLAVAYYFLAISVDKLSDCADALRAYQEFVKLADPVANKTEIEDANIRIGLLEKLVKRGTCKPVVKGSKKQ